MVEKFRRVVTGHDDDGKSVFIFDGAATAVKEMESMPGLALTDLWQTNGAPADNTGEADAVDRPVVLEPPANGTILRIVEFPPDGALRDRADGIRLLAWLSLVRQLFHFLRDRSDARDLEIRRGVLRVSIERRM